jgi:Na+/proline symporter
MHLVVDAPDGRERRHHVRPEVAVRAEHDQTGAMLDAAGQPRSKEVQDALAVILHLLFGAFLGSCFGLLHRRLRVPGGGALQGIGYGLLVWSVNYKGWIPALSILPPPERDRPDRSVIVALAHAVFGWTTAAVVDARERSARE